MRACVVSFNLIVILSQVHALAEDETAKGTMTVKGQKYTVTTARAFKFTSNGQESISIIASVKPFMVKNRWEDPLFIDALIVDRTSKRLTPQVQVVFDAQVRKPCRYRGFGGQNYNFQHQGTTINGVLVNEKIDDIDGEAKPDGKTISGKIKVQDDEYSFDFEFKASIEELKPGSPPFPNTPSFIDRLE